MTKTYRFYFIVFMVAQEICFLHTAVSQVSMPTFGLIRELRSVRNPIGLLVGDFNGDNIQDLASYSKGHIFIHLQKKDTLDWQTVRHSFGNSFYAIGAAFCNSDTRTDLILLEDNPLRLKVYLLIADEQILLRWSKKLTTPFEQFKTADINNDGKTDILLYGKKNLGIHVFLGLGNGSFQEPTTLFPDFSFSEVYVDDLDRRGIIDVIGVNWIENEILIFTGYGRMKFRQPITLKLEAEPAIVTTARLDDNLLSDLIVGYDDRKVVKTFLNEGAGEFFPLQKIILGSFTQRLFFDELYPKARPALITHNIEQAQISIYETDENGVLNHKVKLSTGKNSSDIVLFNHQISGLKNLAILNPLENRIRVLYNFYIPLFPENVFIYCSGLKPNDIIAVDFLRDGILDIVVSHKESEFIGLYEGTNEGALRGPLPFGSISLTGNLYYFTKNDSVSLLIGEHTEGNRISVIEVNERTLLSTQYSIPTRQSQLLTAGLINSNGLLHLLVLEEDRITNESILVLYDQITAVRFAEHQIVALPSKNLIAAAGTFMQQGNKLQICYVFFNQKKMTGEVYQIQSNDMVSFSKPKLLFSFPLENSVKSAHLWNIDVNRDGLLDVVIILGAPEDTLLCYVAEGNQYVSKTVQQTTPVNVLSRDRLKFFDVNRDRNVDIVIDNSMTKTIQVYEGRGDGAFHAPYRLTSSEGFGGFTLSDINLDGAPDLIVSDAANGCLRVIVLKPQE